MRIAHALFCKTKLWTLSSFGQFRYSTPKSHHFDNLNILLQYVLIASQDGHLTLIWTDEIVWLAGKYGYDNRLVTWMVSRFDRMELFKYVQTPDESDIYCSFYHSFLSPKNKLNHF